MRRESIVPVLALTFALVIVPARLCQAQWQVNGGPVCTAVLTQTLPMIVSDGAGGAIVTWYDGRSGNNYIIIYAQRLNAAGVPQWTADGVALCSVAGALFSDGDPGPAMVSDGAGGAIVTWSDGRSGNGDIYAQRVSAAGVPQWTADGVALCTNPSTQYPPAIASDGAGGAIVAWADFRNSSSPNFQSDIYAQRITAAGVPQWTADGVALCTNPSYQYSPTIASDGAGGAIVTWYDQRRNFPGTDIYAQRVSAAGAPQWTADGVALCPAAEGQVYPRIVSDGAGGAIVAWEDSRSSNPSIDIYAQRVSEAGVLQWTLGGVALCTTAANQATIASDGAGGAIVTWQDYRSGTNYDIYAQRVDAAGAPQWTADGVALCSAASNQGNPTIASDGAGGAVVSWQDSRSGANVPDDIYAQRVSAAGAPQWTADGAALCTVDGLQIYPTIVSDGAGGAIVTWEDTRSGVLHPSDIYAQRVNGSGGVLAVPPPSPPASFLVLAPAPNPAQDGKLTIRFELPSTGRVSAQILDLAGHRVRTLATDHEYSPGPQVLGWDGKNDAGVGLPSGVYFVEVREGAHSEARRAVLLR
jgi:hypothetical protein